jgi:hypothetical protein
MIISKSLKRLAFDDRLALKYPGKIQEYAQGIQ